MRIALPILVLALTYGIHVPCAGSNDPEPRAEPCMRCHVVDNAHGGPVLNGLPSAYLLKQFELYRSGKRFGPIMQSQLNALATQDLQDLAAYFAARRPTPAFTQITIDQQEAQRGRTLASDLNCAQCHGQEYRGKQEVPRLAGQRRSYLALAIGRLQRDSSLHPPMSPRGELMPQASIEAIAAYLASLEP